MMQMVQVQLQRSANLTLLLLTGVWGIGMAIAVQPTWAQDGSLEQVVSEPPTITVEEWLAQIAQASVVQVLGVRVAPSDTGLEIILETAEGELAQPSTSIAGNALILDIPNAALADRDEFQIANPAEGIAFISVTNFPGDRLRVSLTGTDAPPVSDIRTEAEGLVLSIVPGTEHELLEEEAIQVIVTGEIPQSGYAATDATVGTRIEAPLRDIPRSIQVIPEQVIEDQNAIRLEEVLRNASGATRGSSFGGTADEFLLRGFTADIFRNGLPDVPGASTFSSLRETVNLDRVEVLRGPASILYGSLSPGGVINLVTKQPLEEPFYAVELSVGNFSLYRPSIDLSGSLTGDGRLLYRLNAVYENSSSFRDFTDIERIFVAPVLSWRIGDRTNLTFELEYLNDERPFDGGLVAIGDEVADIPIERRLGEPSDVRRVEDLSVGYRLEHQISEGWTLRNSFRGLFSDNYTRRFEARSLDETTGILEREFRIVEADRQSYALRTEAAGEFATGAIQHQALVGIDLSRVLADEIGFRERPTEPINIFDPVYFRQLPDAPLSFATEIRTNSLGIYLQDLISFTDNLKLLLGGRLDFVGQTSRDTVAETDSEQDDTAFSPTIGLVYQPSEEISLYGSFSRSFQPNFAIRADGSFLEPERGTQYEIGMRGVFFNSRLTSNLAFYRLIKSNVGITDPNNPDFSIPLGAQRSQGIELDVSGEIAPGWNVIATYTHTDASITEGDEFTPEGNQLTNVPRNSASLWTTYEIQSGDLRGLGFGAGLFFVGDRPGNFENDFTLPGYLRTDAALYYRRDRWRAALNIRNLFDVRYFESSTFGRTRITPGAPFTIIGSVAVEF
jgi:iron complex outermembrane receptor protein